MRISDWSSDVCSSDLALRPFVADDDDRTFLDLTRLDRGEAILLALEHLRRAAELQAVNARHLDDGPLRRERSIETKDAAGRGDRRPGVLDHLLVRVPCDLLEALGHASCRERVCR